MYIATLQSVSKNKNIRKPPLNLIIKTKTKKNSIQLLLKLLTVNLAA